MMVTPAGLTDAELAYRLDEARAVVNELVAEENTRLDVRSETDRVLADLDKALDMINRHPSGEEQLAAIVGEIVRDAKARTGRNEEEEDDDDF